MNSRYGWSLGFLGLLLLAAYSPIARHVFATHRAERKLQASWAEHGVYPFEFDGKLVTGVSFSRRMPMTLRSVAAF